MGNLQQTVHALNHNMDLQLPDTLTEEEILQLLAAKVSAYLNKNGTEAFFQLMYRLDIQERKLAEALQKENASILIARLVFDRQMQKIQSRNEYRKDKDAETDPELNW